MRSVALKGLAARKVRAVLTALAVVIGVAMVSGTFILTDTMLKSFDGLFADSVAGTDATIRGKEIVKGSTSGGNVTIPASLLEKVRALPEVGSASGVVSPQEANPADIIGHDGKAVAMESVGFSYDPAGERFSVVKLKTGKAPQGPGEVAIDAGTAKDEHYKLGDPVVVSTLGEHHRFKLSGTVSFGDVDSLGFASIAVWDVKTAQSLLHREGRFDGISVAAKPGTSRAQLVRAIAPLLPADVEVKDARKQADEDASKLNDGMAKIRMMLLAFGGIALLVGAFVIFNTLSITVAQRTREFATLRTLGATRTQIKRSVKLEGLVIGLVASVLGIVLGYGIAKGMFALVAALGVELPEAETVVAQHTITVSLLVGTGVTLLASILPARRATRVPPIAAVREGATLPTRRRPLAGMVVKPLVGLLGWPARRSGTAGELAGANAVRNPGRTIATAAALMIGITLVTIVAALGAGINRGIQAGVSEQVHAAYVIDGKQDLPFRAAEGDELAALPGVKASSQVRMDNALVQGREHEVTGLDPATIARFYSFTWTAGSLAGLDDDGAVVAKGYAEDAHLRLGSVVTVKTPSGASRRLTVRGIYDPPEQGALLGELSMSKAAFDDAFAQPKNGFTFLDAGASAGPKIKAATERFSDAAYHTGAAYPKDATKDMAIVLGILYVLLGFSVIVSLFGMVNTMVLSVFERTREIGMLRTIGMTRRQARRMIRHESVITALIGTVLGLGLGLLVAWGITAAVGVDGLPFVVPVPTLAVFTLLAVVAGIGAAVMPARRASRLNVLSALQYE
jgi:putative ABC transport system permease protein